MALRASLCIVLALTCSLTVGCSIFGKKKSAQAKLKQQKQPIQSIQPVKPEQAVVSRSATAKRAADEQAIRDALNPKDSSVEWPGSKDLKLGGDKSAAMASNTDEDQFTPRTKSPVAAPKARDEDVVVIETPEHLAAKSTASVKPTIELSPTPTPAPQAKAPVPSATVPQADAAVANHGLSIEDSATPPPVAAKPEIAIAKETDTARPAVAVEKAASPIAQSDSAGDLSKRIAQRLRENPNDISAQLDNQLLKFLNDEKTPDLNTLSTLQPEDRELLTALVDGLSNFRNAVRSDHNLLLPGKVRPILDLASRVRSLADLSIPTIALCTRVVGFGSYEPLDGRFIAGEPNKAIVYCEVANVASTQNDQGWWESKLSQETVLYTEDGQRVWVASARIVRRPIAQPPA